MACHFYPAAITADAEVLNPDMASVGLYVGDAHTLWFDYLFSFFPHACQTFSWLRITYQNQSCPSHSVSPVIMSRHMC